MEEWTDAPEIVVAIAERLNEFDWHEAEALTQSLVKRLKAASQAFPRDEASQVLKQLRRKRQFSLMTLVADALRVRGASDPTVIRQYAQALIDQGQLDLARLMLAEIAVESDTLTREQKEAKGLSGRIYKQMYVNANNPTDSAQQANLRQSISHYDFVYAKAPDEYWHGINVVALLARAERDRVDVEGVRRKDFREFAKDILRRLEEQEADKGDLDYWDRATSIEAHVALGEFAGALKAARKYVLNPAVDAFECFSTQRQLREVWQLGDRADGGSQDAALILAVLDSALLKRSGGEVQLRARDVEQGLQANFSGEPDLPFTWWQTGLERCKAIARIEDKYNRKRGSGFLVRAGDFLDEGGDERLLLTNWHVISKDRQHPLSIAPGDALANFEAAGCRFQVASEMVAYKRDLDASLVRLEDSKGLEGHCPLEPMPAPFDVSKKQKQRLYVIGYPGGRSLSFSIHDSVWLDFDGTRLHYRTPTEGGSSGSPVFDQENWTLLGLHHKGLQTMPRLRGEGTYQANEAISVTAIREAFKTVRRS